MNRTRGKHHRSEIHTLVLIHYLVCFVGTLLITEEYFYFNSRRTENVLSKSNNIQSENPCLHYISLRRTAYDATDEQMRQQVEPLLECERYTGGKVQGTK